MSKEFHGLICAMWRFNVFCVLNLVPAHFIWFSQLMLWKRQLTGNLETRSLSWLWLHLCCIPSVTWFWDLWLLSQSLGCTELVIIPAALPIAISSLPYLFRVCGIRPAHSIQDRQISHSYSDLIIFSLSFFVPFLVISKTQFFPVSEKRADVFTQLPIITPRSQSWSDNNHLGAHNFA